MNVLKNLALLAIGATVGYLAAVWNLEKKYYEDETEVVEATTETVEKIDEDSKRLKSSTYGLDIPSGEFSLTETAATAIRNYQQGINTPIVEIPDEDDFVGANDNPNDPTIPYIITPEEFIDPEDGFEKIEVTYYKADDVVCDKVNVKLSSAFIKSHIGRDNLDRLGEEYVIFVRAEQFEKDFEVNFHPGSYSVEVEGLVFPDGDRVA